MRIVLGEIAHFREGDKGDTANVSVFPYDDADYDFIRHEVTEERVREAFGPMVKGAITRYEAPGVCGLNFVLGQALSGGSTKSLAADIHGKSWAGMIAGIELDRPDA
jgi:hypothetical protein